MRPLRRLSQLSWTERWLLLRAAAWLVLIRLGLWLLPFRLLRNCVCSSKWRSGTATHLAKVDRIRWAVAVAGAWVPGTTHCLTQALALQAMLHRAGYPAAIRIGVMRSGQRLVQAHAWVHDEGRILLGERPDLDVYQPIVDLTFETANQVHSG